MMDIEVIEDPAAAEASLDPIRTRILHELAEPWSATQLAGRVGLPRQKVNYHLKALERHGLVELVEERRKGNVTERVVQEVGKLITGAAAARQKLATFAIDGEITFRSPADRAAFAEELGVAVTRLVDKYHDAGAAA